MSEPDNYDSHDEASFNEALARRDAGDLAGAIVLLRALSVKRPNKASVVGMLAGLELDTKNYSSAVEHGQRAVSLAPRSELASRVLFHALFGIGDIDAAFAEAGRFRTIRDSVEYDRILAELEDDTLRKLDDRAGDVFLTRLLTRVRDELKVRPVKQ